MSAVLHLTVAAADVDLAVDVLWSHGALGVHEEADGPGAVRLVTAFGDDVDPAAVGHEVAARVDGARVTVVDDDGAWWDAWRAHAAPIEVGGGRVVVVPAWRPHPAGAPGALVVPIDPGRTFGSGAHATTRLVLEALVELPLVGASVLDVGCGSGVLGIVAARLGAARVVGVDIDPACLAVVAANAEANGVTGRVRATTEELGSLDGPFDVVVANLLLPALEVLAPGIDRLAGGRLLISGMLVGTTERAIAAFGGWHLAARSDDDVWSSALLVRDSFLG